MVARMLDTIAFDTRGFVELDAADERVWLTPEDDLISLRYFVPSWEFDAELNELDRFRDRYRSVACSSGSAIVEVDIQHLDGHRAIRSILKVPQQPTGMTYLGSLIVLLRQICGMVKVQCAEHGITGLRDTAVFAELMREGQVIFGADGPLNWMSDPYDPAIVAPLARNRSEDMTYDARFPDHPLSRARRNLDRIAATLQFSSATS